MLKNKLKEVEINFNTEDNIQSYNTWKKLDSIYDYLTEDVRIQSKCDWYEHGEKSTKLFLNLEKKNVVIKIKFASLYLTKNKKMRI